MKKNLALLLCAATCLAGPASASEGTLYAQTQFGYYGWQPAIVGTQDYGDPNIPAFSYTGKKNTSSLATLALNVGYDYLFPSNFVLGGGAGLFYAWQKVSLPIALPDPNPNNYRGMSYTVSTSPSPALFVKAGWRAAPEIEVYCKLSALLSQVKLAWAEAPTTEDGIGTATLTHKKRLTVITPAVGLSYQFNPRTALSFEIGLPNWINNVSMTTQGTDEGDTAYTNTSVLKIKNVVSVLLGLRITI